MIEYTYDAHGNLLTYKDSTGYWEEITRDAQGNELTYKDSTGYWEEITRDAQGNMLTFKDSNGDWREYTRDAQGNLLAYKDSTGFSGTSIANDDEYTLFVSKEGHFKAGCRYFKTKEAALAHWDRGDSRAVLFTKAIRQLNQ